ncbi:CGNR zinc finger domain-containing protein [Saccharopolyspora oryzae]|uniref:CGNR zinc finger domain-containing protein n=1 Tax=Saccharopolyspora oryzae TaxID=2997343 RepID=A0ABT4UQY1_9PSEU|nr:CGNR zinc finger domain-containing protein [Saccharopolyspora oryzae]MDA3624131.1 CGNR zinc finger domain-containing protein [Saccharopolyspora oryzae]
MAYDRPPAPPELQPVEAFGNSARFLYDEDALVDLGDARTWLREHGWGEVADELDDSTREELFRAREAIREHLAGTDSAPLNDYARRLLRAPQWQHGEIAIPVDGSTAAERMIGDLVVALVVADLSGKPGRLKVCQAEDCRWLYYDRSPGNNSIWCSMDICGARHKMRAYRARRKDT